MDKLPATPINLHKQIAMGLYDKTSGSDRGLEAPADDKPPRRTGNAKTTPKED